MKVTVKTIVKTEPDAFKGLTKTTFEAEGQTDFVYMFSKPENVPTQGEVLDGEITPDKAGMPKFTRAKQEGHQSAPRGSERVYKADPDKLKLEKNLEVARNQSIQRQKAADLATQLYLANKRLVLREAFDELMLMIAIPWEPPPAPPESPDEPAETNSDDLEDFDFEEALDEATE